VHDESKRSVSVAKLFPDNHRLTDDCLPYDHACVLLMKPADNYINAKYWTNFIYSHADEEYS
jgi:protein tyrosine phosphatase